MDIKLSHYQEDFLSEVVTGTGSIVLQAVAGSGKTFTSILASTKIPRNKSAIFLAFNKHIVDEMKKKLPSNVEARTCHSLAYKPVSATLKHGRLDVQNYKYHDLCDVIVKRDYGAKKWNEQKEIKDQIVSLVNFARNTLTPPDKQSLHNMCIQYGIDLKDDRFLEYVPDLLTQGKEMFKQIGVIDYTDMIWLVIELDLVCPKFDYIFVDEAQDLNAVQHALIKKCSHSDTRVFAVGDSMQSMYGFTGALNNSLDILIQELNAKPMPLSICYRCPKKHLELARHVDNNRTEWAESAEEGILEFMLQKDIDTKVHSGDLILCRLTAPLIAICIKLIAKGKAAKVLGRNIGKSMLTMIDQIMDNDAKWEDFVPNMEAYENAQVEKLRKRKDAEYQVEFLRDKVDALRACHVSPLFDTASESAFKRKIESLFSEDQTPITLCTVHRAKGLEANNVFIINDSSEKDCMPLVWKNQQRWQMEQELNIMYVALTRAKQALYICSSTPQTLEKHKRFYLDGAVRNITKKKSVTETPVTKDKIDIYNPTTQEIQDYKTNEQTEPPEKESGTTAITTPDIQGTGGIGGVSTTSREVSPTVDNENKETISSEKVPTKKTKKKKMRIVTEEIKEKKRKKFFID